MLAVSSSSQAKIPQGTFFTTEEMAQKIASFLLGKNEQLLLYATESFLKFSIDDVVYRMEPSSKDKLIELVRAQFHAPLLPVQFEEENTPVSSMPFDEKCTLVGRFCFHNQNQVAQDVAELAYEVLKEKKEIEIAFHEGLATVLLNGKSHEVDARGGLIEKIEGLALQDLNLEKIKKTTFPSAGFNPVPVTRLELKEDPYGSARS